VELVRRCGGHIVACAFVIELAFLNGRRRLDGAEVRSLIRYDHV
jgi:adenine phosphoribosyltransferase